jgi:uncharacterized membrane protein YfcA
MEITSSTAIALLLVGALVGVVGGMIGIGGGILVIPLLMFFFGFTQQKANGTSLAMLLPPIGLLAVIRYYQAGNIDIKVAMLLACGFAGGAYLGAWIVNRGLINPTTLRVTFALFLIYVAANLLFRTGGHPRAALETSLMVVGFASTYLLMRLLGRKYLQMPSFGNVYRERLKRHSPYDFEI